MDVKIEKYTNELLKKSEEAYLMALEIVNKPTINYRTEGFCFFICNAWELLLKAFLIRKSENILCINFKDDPIRTIGLAECVERVFTSTTDKTKINISYIRNIRNKATHLIIPDYDFLLSDAYQRCITNYNAFFKKKFSKYNFNQKISPFVALVNPGSFEKSSLMLNPQNLLVFNDLLSKLNADDSLGQTLRLISTKKESEADIKYMLVDTEEDIVKFINIPKNIKETHPYTTTEVIRKICETLIFSLGINHKFNKTKFHDIVRRKKVKENQTYCYFFEYSKTGIYKYSEAAIEYISYIYISEQKILKK